MSGPTTTGGGTTTTTPQAPQNQVQLKNFIDISDDTIVYNRDTDNPISFVKSVVAQAATPNVFRTKKEFYGRFIMQLYEDNSAGKTGGAMFDPMLAAMRAATGEAAAVDQMKIFVCIVHVEELQNYPMPLQEDWELIRKIASNGGIFKAYAYAGETPNYGDNVLVSFNDPTTRTEGIFINPLVGGASGAPIGGSGGGGSAATASGAMGNCRNRTGTNAARPLGSEAATSEPTAAASGGTSEEQTQTSAAACTAVNATSTGADGKPVCT